MGNLEFASTSIRKRDGVGALSQGDKPIAIPESELDLGLQVRICIFRGAVFKCITTSKSNWRDVHGQRISPIFRTSRGTGEGAVGGAAFGADRGDAGGG